MQAVANSWVQKVQMGASSVAQQLKETLQLINSVDIVRQENLLKVGVYFSSKGFISHLILKSLFVLFLTPLLHTLPVQLVSLMLIKNAEHIQSA